MGKKDKLRLIEKRKHPRFLLTREQFRETKTSRIFPVYDLSQSGLSIKVEEKLWSIGTAITGILNLHPESIEMSPRLIEYYGDRAALKMEALTTYARSVLQKVLSPKRLGQSLQLVKEKLPIADYWFHGVCNTDVLLKLSSNGDLSKIEVFFANYYWSWNTQMQTGICQSIGDFKREELFLADEPVKLESIHLCKDNRLDLEKVKWAQDILAFAAIDSRLKEVLLKVFNTKDSVAKEE